MKDLQSLIDLITLEQLDTCLFRGQNFVTPWRRVFGGQVLAQSLNAAYQTVPEDRLAHSLHGYFILGGDVDVPIIYTVDVLRDGGSFTTRRVTATQKGKAIFVMAASFQVKQKGVDHQNTMPEAADPGSLLTDMEQAELIKEKMPDIYLKIKGREQHAFEFRPEKMLDFDSDMAGKEDRNVWMKVTADIEMSMPLQHQLLAYASDYDLLLTAVYPHRDEIDVNRIFLASIDHAMYFHRDFDLRQWQLYSIDSPSASNSRGMGYGRIFSSDGTLVSTVVQEGLIREMREKG
ncbi:acyl-CoA thioesterase II [Saprospiraceae bacterium]|nr:acyl-CoA thioesterase II [Saprospiraceae bacterium]